MPSLNDRIDVRLARGKHVLAPVGHDYPCFEVPGYCNEEGYPQMSVAGKTIKMSRLILERKRGKPLGDLFARHTCDNTRCVEETHLIAGTAKDNMQDKVQRGRHRFGRFPVIHNPETLASIPILRAKGLTYQQISDDLGVSRSYVRDLCIGRRPRR